ncbi:MAG: glycosyltransferase family 2 protein [Solobacterium sp.]|nr:glycosyltransferase family 2 protein [Solobacterium sp.]MBR3344797.1 glycosyltransferase family 2 protein [Solobacterium sp.]
MPEISVVVPVYNVRDYLRKNIESILAQTFTDYELILVNDGSKDDSLSILREYEQKDPRITVIDKPNGGLSDARNAGMAIASGKYIQFIDSDDFVEPQLLEKCRQKLEETGADMVIFDIYQYFLATGKKEIIANTYDASGVYSIRTNPELIVNIQNCAWNKMYKLSLFKDNDIIYPWGCYYEDLGTTYRLLARCDKVAFINEPLYDYLQDRPGNITHQFNFSVYHVLDMVKLTLDDYKNLGIYETYYEELKCLGARNILECLKKTRNVNDKKMTEKFVQVCFWYIKNNWPEFPKCRYPILREKNDWIYANEKILRLYLAYRRRKLAKEVL